MLQKIFSGGRSLYEDLAKFRIGKIYVTEAAGEVLAASAQDEQFFTDMHAAGEYGNILGPAKLQNDRNIKLKGSILSEYYTLKGQKIWVMTDQGHERTSVCLPGEE